MNAEDVSFHTPPGIPKFNVDVAFDDIDNVGIIFLITL
jgi:hypothetical protein